MIRPFGFLKKKKPTMTSADFSLPLGREISHGKLYPLPTNVHDLLPTLTFDFRAS
jgi:hypothetical protein